MNLQLLKNLVSINLCSFIKGWKIIKMYLYCPRKVSLAANIKRKCLLADNFGKLNKINIFSFLGHFGSTFWACLMAN